MSDSTPPRAHEPPSPETVRQVARLIIATADDADVTPATVLRVAAGLASTRRESARAERILARRLGVI